MVGRRRSSCSTPGPTSRCGPYQIWRHRLGTPPATTSLVLRRARRALLPRVSADPQRASGSSSTPTARRASEVWLLPADDPTAPPPSCGRAPTDVEYHIDHWGDRFVDAHQPRRARLPGDDRAASTRPDDGPSWSPTSPAGGSRRPSRSPATSSCTSGAMPSRGCASCVRDGRRADCSTSAPSRTTSSSAPTREWDVDDAAALVPVAHDAGVGVRRRRRDRRARRCASRRRPRTSTSTAYMSERDVGDRRRRHAGAGRRRAPRRHAARRHGAVRRVRVRLVRVVDAAVVLGRPAVAARPRRRVGARPPPRRRRARPRAGTSTAGCSNKRNTFTDTWRAPSTSSPAGYRRPRPARHPRRQRRRAARRGVHHDAARPVRAGRRRGARSSTSSRR